MRVPFPTNADIGKQLTVAAAAPLTVVWTRPSNYLGAFDDSTRSQALVVSNGDFIYNDDDKTFNLWDADLGVWRNMQGVLT